VLDLFIASARGLALTALEHRQLAHMRADRRTVTPKSRPHKMSPTARLCPTFFLRLQDATRQKRRTSRWTLRRSRSAQVIGTLLRLGECGSGLDPFELSVVSHAAA